jgi:hypothetical protein
MKIETLEESEKNNSPVIGVYDVKLKVSDGIRFGFGFGLGIFLWIGLLFAIFIFSLYLIGASIIEHSNPLSFLGINSNNQNINYTKPAIQSEVNNSSAADQQFQRLIEYMNKTNPTTK